MHVLNFTKAFVVASALTLMAAGCGSDTAGVTTAGAVDAETTSAPQDNAVDETAVTEAPSEIAAATVDTTGTADPAAAGEPDDATWDMNAEGDGLEVGDRLVVDCAPGGYIGHIYGAGTYASDSSICTAGVYEGLITLESGGPVVVEIAPGLDFYGSGEANDVVAENWESWPRSFTLPADQTPP